MDFALISIRPFEANLVDETNDKSSFVSIFSSLFANKSVLLSKINEPVLFNVNSPGVYILELFILNILVINFIIELSLVPFTCVLFFMSIISFAYTWILFEERVSLSKTMSEVFIFIFPSLFTVAILFLKKDIIFEIKVMSLPAVNILFSKYTFFSFAFILILFEEEKFVFLISVISSSEINSRLFFA